MRNNKYFSSTNMRDTVVVTRKPLENRNKYKRTEQDLLIMQIVRIQWSIVFVRPSRGNFKSGAGQFWTSLLIFLFALFFPYFGPIQYPRRQLNTFYFILKISFRYFHFANPHNTMAGQDALPFFCLKYGYFVSNFTRLIKQRGIL